MDGLSGIEHCEFLEDCRFFALFCSESWHCCSRFTRARCRGPLADRCEKSRFRLRHGRFPGIGMTPTVEREGGF